MATMESLAIREELARTRIANAIEQLSAQLGKSIPPLGMAKAKDPKARGAQLAEECADILESMLTIAIETDGERVNEPEPEPEEEKPEDGDDNTGNGSSNPAQPTKEPIKRSQTKRK